MIRLESLLLYQEHGAITRKLATLGVSIFIKVVTLRGGPHRHGDVQAWCSGAKLVLILTILSMLSSVRSFQHGLRRLSIGRPGRSVAGKLARTGHSGCMRPLLGRSNPSNSGDLELDTPDAIPSSFNSKFLQTLLERGLFISAPISVGRGIVEWRGANILDLRRLLAVYTWLFPQL